MRIAIASGKGGAGKTMIAASLAFVWDSPCLIVDADVEAPNLHLFLRPRIQTRTPVHLEVPVLHEDLCDLCGACREICRFNAVAKLGKTLKFFSDMCHGCGGCFAVCPRGALSPGHRVLGEIASGTAGGNDQPFLMGQARIGEAMTPPQLRALQQRLEASLLPGADALIDAPPGTSCPAMTVAAEADLLLLAAEPTPFGFHDFQLAVQAFSPLNKTMVVVMNKAGMEGNAAGEEALASYCGQHGLPVAAALPFSRELAVHYAAGGIAAALSQDWEQRFRKLKNCIQNTPLAAS